MTKVGLLDCNLVLKLVCRRVDMWAAWKVVQLVVWKVDEWVELKVEMSAQLKACLMVA